MIRRHPTKKQRAMKVLGAAETYLKAKVAWIAGKKAAKVAAPAVAVGTAAVVIKKRSAGHEAQDPATSPPTPAVVA